MAFQAKGPPGYIFHNGEYYILNPNGRRGEKVTEKALLKHLREIHEQEAQLIADLVESYFEDGVDAGTVETALRSELKTLNLSMAALAVGGWDNVSSATLSRTERELSEQYEYLAAFMLLVAAEEIDKQDATERAKMYVDSGFRTFWGEMDFTQRQAGRSEELLIPQIGACKQCLSIATLGWQPIGTYSIPVHVHCRCSKEYR